MFDELALPSKAYGSVILIAVTGHWISQARQKMQSFSLIGSAFLGARIACPLLLGLSQSGVSNQSKTFTGHTEMQIPSAMQTSKSTATIFPWIPSFLGG